MIALALLAAAPLTCGGVPRPGVATLGVDGAWRGTAVAACRRAAARLDRAGFRFRGYRTLAALRTSGDDDIAFLAANERAAAGGQVPPTAVRVASSVQVLVARKPIAGDRPVLCFIIGSAAEDALEGWLGRTHRDAVPLGFQEPDEMADGLASGACAAMAVDAAERAGTDSVVEALATLLIDAYARAGDAPAMAAALRD